MRVKLLTLLRFVVGTLLVPYIVPSTAMAQSLAVCTEASPDGFDVVQYNSLVTTNASADLVFNGLIAFDETTRQIVPALATSWEASADGRSYTFHLRPNVQFHTTNYFKPTRAFNADDVTFTFERMLNPQHPWHKITGPSGFPHAQAMQLPTLVKAIKKIDAHTVRFILNEPNATFLPVLTMGFASIYSAEYANQLLQAKRTNNLNVQPIGTGPFVLRSYQKDAIIRYVANPHYWGPRPKIGQLAYVITPDAAVRAQKLKAGECEMALSPRPQDVLMAKRDKLLKVEETPAFMTSFIALNTQHKPFDNQKVRQAINLAFDRSNYIKTIFSGTATPAYLPYPPNTWSYAKQLTHYPYNPIQAKKLLAEAGFPKGFNTTIWTRPTGSTLNPNPKTGAELLQADLAKIGIKAQVKVIEWGELIREAKLGQHDLLFMGWAGDNGDPDNYLTPQFSCAAVKSGTNFTRFCDPKLDKSIAEGKTNLVQAQRAQSYITAQQIIHEQALWLPIAYPTATVLMKNKISGYRVSPFGRQNFTTVQVN